MIFMVRLIILIVIFRSTNILFFRYKTIFLVVVVNFHYLGPKAFEFPTQIFITVEKKPFHYLMDSVNLALNNSQVFLLDFRRIWALSDTGIANGHLIFYRSAQDSGLEFSSQLPTYEKANYDFSIHMEINDYVFSLSRTRKFPSRSPITKNLIPIDCHLIV